MSPPPTSACFVPRKKGVWALGCLGTVAHYGASGCFPTCLEPGKDPSSRLPLAQTNAGRQKILIFLPHLRPSLGPSKAPKLPVAVPDPPARGWGQGVLGEGAPRVQAGKSGGRPPPSRTASANSGRRRDSALGDGWSQVGREESDLWGQGASRSIWAGQVRGNQYFR